MTSNSQTLLLSKSPQDTFPLEMIEVKGSTFQMGGTKHSDEKPIHEVTVPTFWIGKYPVTQSLYEWVMGENPSYFQGKDRPVESVSWNDAQIFIRQLNQISEKQFRLPSEAEWEYAARGGIYWSKNYYYAGSNDIEKVAWHIENNHEETKPVGLKQPNQLGIYDMSGNLGEWCEDNYGNNMHRDFPLDGSAWINEYIVIRDDVTIWRDRVIRGGFWLINGSVNNCNVCQCFYGEPRDRYCDIGFRLVLSHL